jgi:hypothetical protein
MDNPKAAFHQAMLGRGCSSRSILHCLALLNACAPGSGWKN